MNTLTANRAARWGGGAAAYHPRIDLVLHELVEPQSRVVNHEVYRRLDSMAGTRAFMEHHAFAVLDFMWLLKSLQRTLTCVSAPWVPVGHPNTRRFINEIVLEEESDRYGDGFTSHFELYLRAMGETGADTGPIQRFVDDLRRGSRPATALRRCGAPLAAQRFVANTWAIIERSRPHELAGAFAFGRENLIPSMFTALVALRDRVPGHVEILLDYLERHIELDGEHHTPLAFGMLAELCGEDAAKWDDVVATATACLRSRVALWDGVVDSVTERQAS